MKTLLIMLTRFQDIGSRIISLMTGCRYTHASIALGEDPETFYSFNLRGFHIEHPKGLLEKEHAPFPCRIYGLEVTDNIYDVAKKLIHGFKERKERYRYSSAGLILAFFHIPLTLHRKFFCSHFVAEILGLSGAMKLKKRSCLYLPGDFQKMKDLSLCFSGTVQGYAVSLA